MPTVRIVEEQRTCLRHPQHAARNRSCSPWAPMRDAPPPARTHRTPRAAADPPTPACAPHALPVRAPGSRSGVASLEPLGEPFRAFHTTNATTVTAVRIAPTQSARRIELKDDRAMLIPCSGLKLRHGCQNDEINECRATGLPAAMPPGTRACASPGERSGKRTALAHQQHRDLQCASTLVATDPRTRLASDPWPCDPISTRSNFSFLACRAISVPGSPTSTISGSRFPRRRAGAWPERTPCSTRCGIAMHDVAAERDGRPPGIGTLTCTRCTCGFGPNTAGPGEIIHRVASELRTVDGQQNLHDCITNDLVPEKGIEPRGVARWILSRQSGISHSYYRQVG